MTRYWIELGCRGHTRGGSFEDHVLELMDALLEEPGATDPDISAELTTGWVNISLGVDADTDRQALDQAIVIVRSAIHKSGGFTPDWKDAPESEFVLDDGFDARVRPAPHVTSC